MFLQGNEVGLVKSGQEHAFTRACPGETPVRVVGEAHKVFLSGKKLPTL